jgi:hypothetical protein
MQTRSVTLSTHHDSVVFFVVVMSVVVTCHMSSDYSSSVLHTSCCSDMRRFVGMNSMNF